MKNIIRFEKLIIENFGSFYGRHEFSFQETGIHRIIGINHDFERQETETEDTFNHSNGSGKSQLIKSLDYAVYGNSPNKKINKDGLINKEAKKNMLVGLILSKDDQKYEIMRYRKYSGRGDALTFKRWDGEGNEFDETLADKNLTQEKIADLIGLNRETFIKTVLMSREGNKNFFELPSAERTGLIESIIKLDKFKEYVQKVKEKLAKAKKDLNQTQTLFVESNSKFRTLTDIIKREINTERQRRQRIKAEEEKLSKENTLAIDDQTEKNIILYMEAYKKMMFLGQSIGAYETSIKATKNNLKYIIETIFERRKSKVKLLDSLSKHHSALLCQHCGKDPDGRHEEHQQQIKTEASKLKTSLSVVKQPIVDLKEILIKIERERDELKKLKEEIKTISLSKEIKTDIINNNGECRLLDRVRIFLKKKNDLENEKMIKKDLKPYLNDRSQTRKEKLSYQKEKMRLEREIQVGELWNSILDYRNDVSIKSFLLKKIVPVYNNILSAILDIVFEGKLTCVFSDTFEETIKYNQHEYDYEQLSTGEKTKLNIAINLAILNLMRINLGGANILFIDELFASIDKISINRYLEILKESYPEIGIYVVSHESGADLFQFDSHITIEKKHQRSKITI